MRVVVTGGAGFIGANLVRALIESRIADSIVVVDDLSTGAAANIPEHSTVELLECSILDLDRFRSTAKDADAIVHLGAIPSVPRSIDNPLRTHNANATGTLNVLEAARDTGAHVVVASSSSVYGATPALPKREDMATRPRSPYAASKLAAESYAVAYASSYGLDILPLRFFNVFGPLQPAGHAYAAVVPAFVSTALAGESLIVHGDGNQTRDFTYVGSVTQVLVDAVRRRVTSPDPVNLAFGTRTSLLELIALLEQILGRELLRRHTEPRPSDVRDSQADSTALQVLFPDLTPVGLDTGLRKTVDWLRVHSQA